MTGDLFDPLGLGSFQRRQPLAKPSELEVGKLYTCSPSVLTGDRSYSRSLWECVSFNRLHACMKWSGGGEVGVFSTVDVSQPILLSRLEHEFDEAPLEWAGARGQY